MRSRIRLLLVAFVGILLVVACGAKSLDMDGTVWQLVSSNGGAPIEGTEITLRFEEGRVRGSSGCNTYDGGYTLGEDGAFNAGQIAVNEIGSKETKGVMDQEVEYLRNLQGADTLARDDTELTIEGGGKTRGGGAMV